MFNSPRVCAHVVLALLTLLGQIVLSGGGIFAGAGEVRLPNGLGLRGNVSRQESLLVGPPKPDRGPTTIYPIVMISSPLKRYFVPTRRDYLFNEDVDLSRHDGFKMKQDKRPGGGRIIASVQGYVKKPEPFDDFGRRNVFIETASGETAVVQGVTLITPEYLKIIALNFTWETAMATSSMPADSLDAILRNKLVTQTDNPDDMLKIARFYIEAQRYELARRELSAIRYKFPEMADRVHQVQILLTQAEAQEILAELKLRSAAGQHNFVYETAKQFPVENVAAPILREVREIMAGYEKAHDRYEQAVSQLGELQGQLKDNPRVKEIAPLRAELAERLTYSSLDRLDAFFKLSSDPQLRPEEKLALALSGWVVGSPNAVTEIDEAQRLWQARFLLLDYLRSEPDADGERRTVLERLESLEGIGAERIAQLLPLLPPILDSAGAVNGQAVRIEAALGTDEPPMAYWVTLPIEYHPDHTYPLIIALHSERGKPEQELQGFWGGTEEHIGQSQRQGYIVIAPEYVGKADTKGYSYSAASHQVVIDALSDARRRFSIDSDRVFLAGHGMGADAAWDMGLAHPHLFAGIIPITGAIDRHAKYYMDNGRQLPIYAVNGEFDRDLITRNGAPLMHMMQQRFDLIYAEYVGAGPEPFYSEIHALFDWMSRQRRPPPPKQVDARTLRESDNRFYWYEFVGLHENFKGFDWTKEKQRAAKAMPIMAKITPGNTLRITSGAMHHRVWLAKGDGLVDFQKRLKVDVNGRNRFNEFIKPDVAVMLDHVRLTGDRQRIYWAMLEF